MDVTNDGDRQGDEVAQLYVRQDVGSVETPDLSLKGLSRIALNPQETKQVTFRIPQDQLAVWNLEGKWAVEAGVSVPQSSLRSLAPAGPRSAGK